MSERDHSQDKVPPQGGRAEDPPPAPERPRDDERPAGGASLDLPLSSPD